MTSRELVLRTLEMDKPERIPRHMWTLPWAENKYPEKVKIIHKEFPDDIVYAPSSYKIEPPVKGDFYAIGQYIDEWGCEFTNIHGGIVGEVKEALIKDWIDINKLRAPEELLSVDIEQVNAFCSATDKFVIGAGLARPFERAQWLRTTEQFFMDLALYPEEVKSMLKILHDFYLKEMEVWCRTDVDAVWFMDDWGSQLSLLISMDMWRSFFKPLYKDYIDLAHSYNKKIFFHSDGYIIDVIPELISMGLDAINSQVFCMGPEKMGKEFKGQITFWGEIDRQHLLPRGSSEEIAEAVDLLVNSFNTDGGLIAQCEFGPGANPDNIISTFRKFDTYHNKQKQPS